MLHITINMTTSPSSYSTKALRYIFFKWLFISHFLHRSIDFTDCKWLFAADIEYKTGTGAATTVEC